MSKRSRTDLILKLAKKNCHWEGERNDLWKILDQKENPEPEVTEREEVIGLEQVMDQEEDLVASWVQSIPAPTATLADLDGWTLPSEGNYTDLNEKTTIETVRKSPVVMNRRMPER